MAYDRGNGNNGNKGNNNGNDANWKAAGFVNFFLPSKDGGRRKLGAIPLRAANVNEKSLNDWLNEDPSRAAKLLEAMQIEYQSAEPNEAKGFDLGLFAEPTEQPTGT